MAALPHFGEAENAKFLPKVLQSFPPLSLFLNTQHSIYLLSVRRARCSATATLRHLTGSASVYVHGKSVVN